MTGFWEALGIKPEEVERVRDEIEGDRSSTARDGRICICGHAVARHRVALGITRCRTGRMSCPCQAATPVLEVSDTRGFLSKTRGTGAEHALGRGMIFAEGLAERSGVPLHSEWLVQVECQRCKSLDQVGVGAVVPCSVTQAGFISDEPQPGNVLLCSRCVGELAKQVVA